MNRDVANYYFKEDDDDDYDDDDDEEDEDEDDDDDDGDDDDDDDDDDDGADDDDDDDGADDDDEEGEEVQLAVLGLAYTELKNVVEETNINSTDYDVVVFICDELTGNTGVHDGIQKAINDYQKVSTGVTVSWLYLIADDFYVCILFA
ncbi:unnamed protein product [Dibothriocephalus latus]|uniref:Uncharacterized protein n=1 Tax=Dibothriocephalus latus TaxID=60516 RepID=A0A3P7LUW7_DIBLA|nr:unnamed protein product [Dibothriocephalus latus]